MGLAYVSGLQTGRRRNASSSAISRMAATCKHFTAFAALKEDCEFSRIHSGCATRSLMSHRNIAQVTGGERELRSAYLKPFNRVCVASLSIMTAYSSYDGIPAIANKRACSTFCTMTLAQCKRIYRLVDGYCKRYSPSLRSLVILNST